MKEGEREIQREMILECVSVSERVFVSVVLFVSVCV